MNTRIQLQAGRSSFPSLAILFGLALLSFSIFAQAPNPPSFTSLDGQELDPNPDGRYSLDDATRGLPFTVDSPTPPRIVAEQVVTPSTIGSYINTPGMRLILEPGNYNRLSIGGTDKEIVFTTGVTVGQLYINGQRIVVRGSPVRTGRISYFTIDDGATDVLLDGIYTDAGPQNLIWNCDRVAVINSRLRQVDYVLAAFPGSGASHVIVGNNYLETYGSAQAAVRLQSIQNLVFVDNNVRATGGNGIFRLHTSPSGQKADNLYTARNQFEGPFWFITKSGTGNQTTNGMGSVWVEENSTYHNGLWYINTGDPALSGWPEVFTLRNNNAYIGSGGWPTAGQHPWDATFENNTEQAYTAPPAWEHQ